MVDIFSKNSNIGDNIPQIRLFITSCTFIYFVEMLYIFPKNCIFGENIQQDETKKAYSFPEATGFA